MENFIFCAANSSPVARSLACYALHTSSKVGVSCGRFPLDIALFSCQMSSLIYNLNLLVSDVH